MPAASLAELGDDDDDADDETERDMATASLVRVWQLSTANPPVPMFSNAQPRLLSPRRVHRVQTGSFGRVENASATVV